MSTVARRVARAASLGSLVALAAMAGTAVLAVLSSVDHEEHERYSAALRQATVLDARINEEVAESRLGLVNHYDDLVRTWDQLSAVRVQLAALPPHLTDPHRADLLARVAAVEEAIEIKHGVLEEFKTNQAVLRNSTRALPDAADRIERHLSAHPSDPTTQAAHELLRNALLLVIAPTENRDHAARCLLSALGGETGEGCELAALPVSELPPAASDAVAALRRHASVIIERQKSVNSQVESLMTVPVAERLLAAATTYQAAQTAAVAHSERSLRLFLAAGVASLVFAAVTIIARMQASATELRATTELLESTNLQLENANQRLAEANQRLAEERDREAELARLKDRFVSVISHELRRPLSVIQSSIDNIGRYRQRHDAAWLEGHLTRTADKVAEMKQMIERVLFIGRGDAGKLEAHPEPIDLAAVTTGVIDEVRAALPAERTLDLELDLPATTVRMDAELFRRIAANLLANAFKYSPDSSVVSLVVRAVPGEMFVAVADRGIGIPEEDLEHLFEQFHRCSNVEHIAGTGLGLSIVKRSVDMQGGTVTVHSEEGKGTRFEVRIPLPEATT